MRTGSSASPCLLSTLAGWGSTQWDAFTRFAEKEEKKEKGNKNRLHGSKACNSIKKNMPCGQRKKKERRD